MIAALALALVGAARAAQEVEPALRAALARGDVLAAQELAAAIEDPLRRARAESEVLHAGGDLPGALRRALGGLESAPDDRELLWRACELAVALELEQQAPDLARRLVRSLANAPPPAGEREEWSASAELLAREARAIADAAGARDAALTRARLVGVGGLLAVLLGLVVAARRPPP